MADDDTHSPGEGAVEAGSRVRPAYRGVPPRDTRFKPGVSGNPKGRPKGAKSIATTIGRELRRTVRVTENGRTRTATVGEVIARQLTLDAMKGGLRAIDLVLRLEAQDDTGGTQQGTRQSSLPDRDALRRIKHRLDRIIAESEDEA